MSKVIRGEGPFECGEIKWERTSVKNNKSPVVTPIIEETPVINPVIDVHPDVTTAGMQQYKGTEDKKCSLEIYYGAY